jgi:hypothetical protein
MKRTVLIVVLLLAACVQLPPTQQDMQAKRFEAIPDKAVIYIVRPAFDSPNAGMITIDGLGMIATQPRTYYRWEVVPGIYQIHGFGATTAAVTVRAEAGKLYFVRHNVYGNIRAGVTGMSLYHVNDLDGRKLVEAAQLL